jgi:hypothetical protein
MTEEQKLKISEEIAKLWETDLEEAIETVAGFRTYLETHYSAFIDFGKWIDTKSELKYAYGKFLCRREVFEVTTLVTYKDQPKMAFDKLSNSIYQYPDEWIYYLLQENNELSDSQINDLKCQVFADRNGIPEQLGYAFKMILI